MEYDGNTHKQCTRCGEVKEFGEYYKGQSACKQCKKALNKAYKEVNKERLRKASSKWRKANKEKIKEMDRAYGEVNKERIRAHKEAYYEVNKERIRADYLEKRKTELFLMFINTQRQIQKENEK